MQCIRNFILAGVCDGDTCKLTWLHLWLKRIFLMQESDTEKIPIIYGSRRIWNAFETFLSFIGCEGYRTISTSVKNIHIDRKLFIPLECNSKNVNTILKYVNELFSVNRHGKIIIYVTDISLAHNFPKSRFKHFRTINTNGIQSLINTLIYNFNMSVIKTNVPFKYVLNYVLKAT